MPSKPSASALRPVSRFSTLFPSSPSRSASGLSSTFIDEPDPPSSPPNFDRVPLSSDDLHASRLSDGRSRVKGPQHLCSRAFTFVILAMIAVALAVIIPTPKPPFETLTGVHSSLNFDSLNFEVPQPLSTAARDHAHRPLQWLRTNSVDDFDGPADIPSGGPRAALISLVRNEELSGILQSMRQLEYHWNRRHRYPWIFFSEAPFTEEFKAATSNATSAPTYYHRIPLAHWSTPPHINLTRFYDSLDYLGTLSVGKGNLISYRHMCRWNSGFFYHHPALIDYDFYWRVEPDVHFFCNIPYDPFAFLAANNLVYGFNMNILEDARSFPSLWATTLQFVREHPEFLHPDADYSWLIDEKQASGYTNCQFFSNFEIGDLRFFRSEAYQAYFHFLDEKGGFFYERYGDAPIHTLAMALFAGKRQAWFFRDIGYQHDALRHCPEIGGGRCACDPTSIDENFYKLVPMESPQKKPADTCVRRWLGGEWLVKKEGWRAEIERAVGGDGFGGYVKQ